MEKHLDYGTRMLEEYLDQEIFVCLRNNSYVYGILRSFDQYYNILLENAKEVFIVEKEYSETESEVFMLRGENIILMGYGVFDSSSLAKVDHSVILEKTKVLLADDLDLDYITL